MATTAFFEEALRDKGHKAEAIDIEFGRSSYYHGENLIYLRVNDSTLILDEATGRRLCRAMRDVGGYLGYED